MASNTRTLADEDGSYSDWIEIHNPDTTAANLDGWFLTDSALLKTKWQIPAVTIPAGGYLVIFASGKNRRSPGATLHTNFALSSGGEYLGLIRPDGETVASDFGSTYPPQAADVTYGLGAQANGGPATQGFLSRATPGAPNAAVNGVALTERPSFSTPSGPFQRSFTLQLSGARPDQQIRYVISQASPDAMSVEPTASSQLYSAPITVSNSAVVRATVFSADGQVSGPTSTAVYTRVDAGLSTFSSRLPVLVIDSMGTGALAKDGVGHPSWLFSFAPKAPGSPSFGTNPSFVSTLTTSVRGSSSAEFPKKSYTLKLTENSGGIAEAALLDLPADDKWALIGPWSFDHGYINNALIYNLSNRIGRWAPQTRFAEVFFNADGNDLTQADYAGIYALTERIEVAAHRVNLKTLDKDDLTGTAVTGGYILKIDTRDDNELGWLTQRGIPENGYSSVVLVAPKADEVAPAQADYIRTYVQTMEDALFADSAAGWAQRTYLDYIDRASWVDHHILNTFACNPDAFIKSAYFTKDRGGKLAAGPVWDFDRALGSYWDERSFRYDVWSGIGGTDVWNTGWWGVIARDPEFMQDWVDRWQSLRKGELATTSLVALATALSAEIGSEAAARDATRWPDNAGPYGGFSGQIERLKGWLTQRAQWIDAQFLAAPTMAISGGNLVFTAPAGAQLVYTLDGSDPRALGGDVAPGALVANGPLTVPAGANVHVRSYRNNLRDTFPGSPWSSAAEGEASTPIAPRARLINISSRAIVGSGEDALVAGAIVADTASKRFLARGIGPGLASFGVGGALADPVLKLSVVGGAELARNGNWETGPEAALMGGYARSVGAFPLLSGVRDAALTTGLGHGAYTIEIAAASGQPGLGLAELYELDGAGRTVNLSTRARVRSGAGVLVGGFVVQGPAYQRMLIRAVGPTLGAFGVAGALRDPVLTVYSGSNAVATNDRWGAASNLAAVTAATTRAGAFQLAGGSEDAALLVTLPPGPYTVEVKGKAGAEGVALLELYAIP
ncbi:MAG: CotH kinase family protein [Opitutaceae bacterium]|nr:CotH kinase family protein [Opitutaceae bacterium]